MTKLNRVTGKVFGGDATATGDNPEIGQFGSALAGTYNGTTDVATIQSLSAWGQGWAGAVTPDTNFPALPEMTGFGKVLSYQNNYVLQSGVPEYDSGTIYYTNDFCRVGNVLYYSLTDDNQANDPTTDTTNWASYNGLFADISASNFNDTGTTYLSGLGMPSGRYIDLELGASGTTYTAPANGWFNFVVQRNSQSISCKLTVTSFGNREISLPLIDSGHTGGFLSLLMPLTAGEIMNVTFSGFDITNTNARYRFFYAEGVPSA